MDWLTGIDPVMAVAAFGIGIVVGLTGMGGGALMTPMMALFFHVPRRRHGLPMLARNDVPGGRPALQAVDGSESPPGRS